MQSRGNERRGAFRSVLLASAIAAALAATVPVAVHAQERVTDDVRRFDIAAQSLPDALRAFEADSGRRVVQPAGLSGRAPALNGAYHTDEALRRLLADSGWSAVVGTDGSYRLVATQPSGESEPLVTAPLPVEGTAGDGTGFQGRTEYDQRTLNSIPAGHGNITSLLRLNPAVELDSGATSSNRPGDLEPADISIHGAKFWQNLFMVDGMSVNNDINPGNTHFSAVNDSSDELHGNKSQGIALDISLVDRVDVHDSNVPAEYGGFNGGVVNAVTRMPSRELRGSVSATHTRDSWAKYHLDDWKEAEFHDTPAIADGYVRNQPEFETTTWRLNLEGHLTDDFGLLGSYTRKRSDIYNQRMVNQSMAEAGATLQTFTNVFRQIDSYFLKGVWTPNDRFTLETVVNHEPHQSEHFNRNAKDGDFIIDGGGSNVGVTAIWEGDRVVQTHKLNWSALDHSRTGGPGWFMRWRHSPEIDWGQPTPTGLALYGTFGDLYQEQESLGYQFKLEWSPLQLGGGEHRFALGAGISRTEATWERKQDYTEGGIPALRPTRTCTDANGVVDTRHCSTSPVTWPERMPVPGFVPGDGQYAAWVSLLRAGRVAVEQTAWSLWIEDDMRFGRARIRPGLRIDGDSYMDKTTIAPRLAFEYNLSEDGHSRIIAGANRYYGRNIFDYALREGRELLHYRLDRGPDLVWQEPVRAALNTTVFNQLDIPYDDELTLGFRQVAWETAFELKYVNRRGRDQIITRRVDGPVPDPDVRQTFHYQYSNAGFSDTDSVSLTVQPLREITLGNTRTFARLIANWKDVDSSHVSYEGRRSDYFIQYEGEFIRWNERPVDNFNRPWTARISTQTVVPALDLTIGSFLSWRGPFSAAMYTGGSAVHEGRVVDVYARREFGTAMTWDLRLAWENRIGTGRETLFANLDITNVLDRHNVATHVDDWAGAYEEYEMGRQFQLEVGYRF